MAVAIDGTSTGSAGFGSSLSWTSHAVAGSLRAIGFGISCEGSATPTISTVTIGGVSCPAVAAGVSSTNYRMRMFYILDANIPATPATIAVTLTGSADGIVGGAVSFTGVDQATPLGTFVGATGTDTAPTVTVSGATGDYVLDTVSVGAGRVPTKDASQAQQWNTQISSASGAGSTKVGAASVAMLWSIIDAQEWAIGAVAFKAEAGGGGGATTAQIMAAVGAHVASGGMFGRRWR